MPDNMIDTRQSLEGFYNLFTEPELSTFLVLSSSNPELHRLKYTWNYTFIHLYAIIHF